MPNIFNQLTKGANNFFNKLPSNANNIVKKVDSGLNTGLKVVGNVAGQVGNALEKSAPLVGAVIGGATGDPELGLLEMDGLNQARVSTQSVKNASNSLKAQI